MTFEKGAKHTRKAMEKKRNVLGMPAALVNKPKEKTSKAQKAKSDVSIPLKDRLLQCNEPILGLGNVCEFLNPRKMEVKLGDVFRDIHYLCKIPGM